MRAELPDPVTRQGAPSGSVGLLASAGNRFISRNSSPTPAQIKLWDRVMVPLSRRFDPLLRYAVGKSVLGVWRKP